MGISFSLNKIFFRCLFFTWSASSSSSQESKQGASSRNLQFFCATCQVMNGKFLAPRIYTWHARNEDYFRTLIVILGASLFCNALDLNDILNLCF